LHSEENAVINCDSPRYVEKIVFVTHLPCVMCAKRLINLGNVRAVYYREEYRSSDALALFEQVGIAVIRLGRD
jgi:dCMP deaminase